MDLLALIGVALGLGFTAGVSPGPMTALVLAETLAGGWRRGVLVAIAPAMTDVPLVPLVWLVSVRLGPAPLAILSLLGGGFLAYLAFHTFDSTRHRIVAKVAKSGLRSGRSTLARAVTTNLLNPNPYLFWSLVGVPLLGAASQQHWLGALFVFVSFIGTLVATKLVLVLLIDRSRSIIGSTGYRWTLRASAAVLLLTALLSIRDGLVRLAPLLLA